MFSHYIFEYEQSSEACICSVLYPDFAGSSSVSIYRFHPLKNVTFATLNNSVWDWMWKSNYYNISMANVNWKLVAFNGKWGFSIDYWNGEWRWFQLHCKIYGCHEHIFFIKRKSHQGNWLVVINLKEKKNILNAKFKQKWPMDRQKLTGSLCFCKIHILIS